MAKPGQPCKVLFQMTKDIGRWVLTMNGQEV